MSKEKEIGDFCRKNVASRTENSLRNIKYGLFFQGCSTVLSFAVRRIFVLMLSKEYLGLDGTFSSILSMLSLTELGVGSAITYSLYKPLAEGNREQIAALMALFRRVYRCIGLTVAVLGAGLMPFLPVIIHELPDIPHIYLIYLLFVADSAISYLYSYKSILLVADQKRYLTTACNYIVEMLSKLLQVLFLWYTKNYFCYLGLKIGGSLLKNLLISHLAGRFYPFLSEGRIDRLEKETKKSILRNTKAMIFHKIGTVVVFGTDNLLLSFFEGVIAVGMYSNYCMVINGLGRFYEQFFQSLTASVGNLGVKETPERALAIYRKINFAGAWLYGFSAVCLVTLFNPFIALWVGREYQFEQGIVCLIALNFYVTGMRQATLIFRDAYGLYWYDRYKSIVESMVNVAASVVLAIPFGVAGIFAGTLISTMATCFWVEPFVLFRHGLQVPVRGYFREYGVNALVTVLTAGTVWYICTWLPGEGIVLFLEKMAVCVVVGNVGYLLVYHRREDMHYFVDLLKVRVAGKISRLIGKRNE